jgi:hypothetical protein
MSCVSRNAIRTVTTLPVLIAVDSAKEADGWGTSFPPDRTESMAVHVVTDDDIDTRLRTIFRPEELPLFVGAIELKQAYAAKDELALQRASEKVRPWIVGFAPPEEFEVKLKTRDGRALSLKSHGQKWNATRWNYSGLMADMFQNARMVIWFSEKEERFSPALYCPDWKTAAFVMTFLGRIRVCPKCSTIFIPSADNVDYCSPAHREAHRVARWRDRKKREKKARKSVR